jgi:hypothetical protein
MARIVMIPSNHNRPSGKILQKASVYRILTRKRK